MAQAQGKIVQCIGAVVDVEFPRDQMPRIYDALKLELQEKERAMADLTVELAILRKKTSGVSWER